ncbi:hypothetical protein J2S58_000536 [Nakamurella flavida]|nr:hypothetical protein [Nakamurella flavida]
MVGLGTINERFSRYRDEPNLSPGLDFHSF